MSISVKDLKRSRIKSTFYCEGEPVYVYNPTPSQKEELGELAMKYMNFDTKEINIDNDEIILTLLRELTSLSNIIPKNNKEAIEILQDPSDLLINVRISLKEIIMEIVAQGIKSAKNITEFYKKIGLNDKSIEKITETLVKQQKQEKKETKTKESKDE